VLAAAGVLAGCGGTEERVVFPAQCQNGSYKPTTIVVTCADANVTVQDIEYSNYGETSAHGKGTASINTCDPTCVAGKTQPFPVTVALTQPRSCGNGEQFTRLTVMFTGTAPPGYSKEESQQFRCAA
jgi:hypothetical protein